MASVTLRDETTTSRAMEKLSLLERIAKLAPLVGG